MLMGFYSSGSGESVAYPLDNCSDIETAFSDNGLSLYWTDPKDEYYKPEKYEQLYPIAIWKGTKVVRNDDHIPENENDGILIVDSRIKDQYTSDPLVDETYQTGQKCFYKLFPYTEDFVVNDDENAVEVQGKVKVTFLNIGGTYLGEWEGQVGETAVFSGESPEPDNPELVGGGSVTIS